jgi:hypothetical protein
MTPLGTGDPEILVVVKRAFGGEMIGRDVLIIEEPSTRATRIRSVRIFRTTTAARVPRLTDGKRSHE